jgi:hypothetical protein
MLPKSVHDAVKNVGQGAPRLEALEAGGEFEGRINSHLNEGDFEPVVGLNVKHVNLVTGDWEAAIILYRSKYTETA